jgi:hypothetical protein
MHCDPEVSSPSIYDAFGAGGERELTMPCVRVPVSAILRQRLAEAQLQVDELQSSFDACQLENETLRTRCRRLSTALKSCRRAATEEMDSLRERLGELTRKNAQLQEEAVAARSGAFIDAYDRAIDIEEDDDDCDENESIAPALEAKASATSDIEMPSVFACESDGADTEDDGECDQTTTTQHKAPTSPRSPTPLSTASVREFENFSHAWLVADEEGAISGKSLYEAYKRRTLASGGTAMSPVTFGRIAKLALPFSTKRRANESGRIFYTGYRLR